MKAYVLDDQKTYAAREPLKDEVKLIKCPYSEVSKYLGSNSRYYKGMIACFDKPENLEIQSNWWLSGKIRSIIVALEKCKEDCASEADREKYFKSKRFGYYTGQ